MKKFYISSFEGFSGIAKYSKDFYNLVLKQKGYAFLDSSESLTSLLSAVGSRDHVHLEIGIFQKKEIEILFAMLKANYKHVSVTLHDPPLVKYPFYEFRNSLLNDIAKFYDKYLTGFMSVNRYVQKIKTIYVLSRKGLDAVKRKYKVKDVFFLPHIVDLSEIKMGETMNNNLIYLGFIGKNKGIEYALQLHSRLLETYPDVQFYVVGTAMGREKRFYENLQKTFHRNVHYTGYQSEEDLDASFAKATFALQPFQDYRFFWPFSGSILYGLKKGKILLTNPVNAIPEIVEHGTNGWYLVGDPDRDLNMLHQLFANQPLLEKMRGDIYEYLLRHHSAEQVTKRIKD